MSGSYLSKLLREVHSVERGATEGPWWVEQNERVWTLHGVHARWTRPGLGFEQIMNWQLIKAPKNGTPYAEYWPAPNDEAFILKARDYVPRLLGVVNAVEHFAEIMKTAGHEDLANDLLDAMNDAAAKDPFQPLPSDDAEED